MIFSRFFVSALIFSASIPSAGAAPTLLDQFPIKAAPATKRGAAQSDVALKSAFPTVAAAQIKGASDVKNLALAKKSVGKTQVFVGVVDRVYAPKHGKFVLLNFAADYKTALIGHVESADFRVFPALKSLKGKRVALRGKVVLFKGAPEIELGAPGAIRIVK